MNRIKTRESVRNIKTLDKSAILGQRMRKAFIRSNAHIDEDINDDNSSSATEYAENSISYAAQTMSQGAAQTVRTGNRFISQTRFVEGTTSRSEVARDTYKSASSSGTLINYRSSAYKHNTYLHGQDLAKSQFKKSYATAVDIKLRDAQHPAELTRTRTSSIHTTDKHKRSIKTAENTSKTKVKTSATASKTRKSTNAPKAFSKSKAKNRKTNNETVKSLAKAIASGVKSLATAIAAGGWVSVVVVVLICIVGLLLASPLGILFSGEAAQDEMRICDVVRAVNEEYENKINEIKANNEYDRLEISGTRAPWKEVLAVYAVNTSTSSLSPMEVVTVDDIKRQLLAETFWSMNKISHHVRIDTKTETVWVSDENGNLVGTTEEIDERILCISIDGKTASQMADGLSFSYRQREQLTALLDDEFDEMWTSVIYGVHSLDEKIVAVAMSQLGNVGGEPYWSWYGFTSRVDWCACFVSWCANECGYIDKGIIPKFAWCPYGAQWFKSRELWMDNSATPSPGMIIFFDWDDADTKGPDGVTDHVAIVERVEDGFVYTIEGNSGGSCRQRKYPVGHCEIYGYGIPAN